MHSKEIQYEIVKHLGTISTNGNYTKEANIIKWGENEPVYDIRVFKTDKNGIKQPLKGISMTKDNMIVLKDLLMKIDFEV